MPTAKTKGAVLYSRVSTDMQIAGTSLEEQREICRAKAAQLNLPVVGEFEDAGISGGSLLLRKAMTAALACIQAGRADTLITSSMSRYSRDVEHQQLIKKAVRAAGGRVIFCDFDFEDTPEGDLNFAIQGGFAEYERQAIRKRTMAGRRRRAAQGLQTARGWSPYGYTIPKTADAIAGRFTAEEVGKYFINEPEAEIVRWLFQSYGAGEFSLPGLTRELNQRGVPTKMGAAQWHPPTLRGILTNTAYIGLPKYGRMTCRKDENQLSKIRPSTGEFYKTPEVRRATDPENVLTLSAPAIIDQATWDQVQERLKTNKSRRGGNPGRTHMLSGRAVCEVCGSAMVMHGGTPHKGYPRYYSCVKHKHSLSYTGESTCTSKESFKVPVAEGATVKAIEEAAQHPEWVQAALANYRKNRPIAPAEDARRELAAIERALNVLIQDEAAAVQAQIAGIRAGASPEAYSAVFAELGGKRKDLEVRRDVVRRTANASRPVEKAEGQTDEQIAAKALTDVSRILRSPFVTEMEKRQAVGLVVEKVFCRKDGAVVTFTPGLFGEDTLQDNKCSFFWKRKSGINRLETSRGPPILGRPSSVNSVSRLPNSMAALICEAFAAPRPLTAASCSSDAVATPLMLPNSASRNSPSETALRWPLPV